MYFCRKAIHLFIFSSFMLGGWRILVHILYRYSKISLNHHATLFSRRAAILGTDVESIRIGKLLLNTPESYFILLGYIDDENISNTDKFLGRISNIDDIIKKFNINEIIVPEKYINVRALIYILDKISNKNVNCKLVPDGKGTLIGSGVVENYSIPLVDLELPLFNRINRINKRIFDIVLASILIFITIPFHVYFLSFKKYYIESIWAKS